ncbi:MAG TPA: ChuX/HutX family heme-like substrate-binding protein [Hyphomicrobiales bacterium]|nr:ChuX/HutX family heme-like substrate-binding protein [Hyphomicrobiales bacterium]
MDGQRVKPAPEAIRRARETYPELRERDLARKLGVSEADYVAAYCGISAVRIEPRAPEIMDGLNAVGEVMALTRNESAVHEKIGVYENRLGEGEGAFAMLGSEINLRVFPPLWAHGFAVEKPGKDGPRRSLQFFDAAGEAVHKVHLRPASDLGAYDALIGRLGSGDQSPGIETRVVPTRETGDLAMAQARRDELRQRWQEMTDIHQYHGLLVDFALTRHQAVRIAGDDLAWPLAPAGVAEMMGQAVAAALPIMCFVGSRGCIQIHAGPIAGTKEMGPWLNVLDETFHLHLRTDQIAETWAVRKPVAEGHVTSIEAYDAAGSLVIQFFGLRERGRDERGDWRALVERLPRLQQPDAA